MDQTVPTPPATNRSSLVRSLSRHLALEARERAFLERLVEAPLTVPKGHVISRAGHATDALHVLDDGWATASGTAPSGQSHAFRLYLPGEVIGLAEIASRTTRHDVRMRTRGAVSRFPREGLAEIFTRYPRLAALFAALASMNEGVLRDHAVALARMDGERRLKTFLLQLRARLHIESVGTGDRVRVPFSQAEIGEMTGMTPIYVNRLLRSWIAAGDLSVDRPYFHLRARQRWETETGFSDPFGPVDTSWFPPA